ncbi:hypothetical protein ILUMI_18113 [Ignelater luminosus]|uniref:Uncharacterized protein n=1 Tax=Ignelater luminosus TaxID=2038154 RepID=A0A8K0CMS0_IGNLU|nr:hypothetical protein ILUMI_18113 [Ignelater luminosus]
MKFLDNLLLTEESTAKFEKDTILQSGNSLWLEERIKIICPSLRHGKETEPQVMKKLEGQLNKNISEWCMFVDEKYLFLGSSPDDITEEDAVLIKIKCSYYAYSMDIDLATENKNKIFIVIPLDFDLISWSKHIGAGGELVQGTSVNLSSRASEQRLQPRRYKWMAECQKKTTFVGLPGYYTGT